jgi:hypothetical protein
MIVDPTVHHEKGTAKAPAVWRVKEEVGSVGHLLPFIAGKQ